ncbi:MAG: hypothetical protein NTZ34_04685 [Chloroflexi bacterium]|nr:hypothetical protein [Chloroflexota bacterium]
MNIIRKSYPLIILILIITLTGVFVPCDISGVQAASQRTLAWSIVDTPSDNVNGMVIRTCGINDLALGPDNRTFYAVSTDNTTPNTGLFKSTDAGYSWSASIDNNLARALGFFPILWNIAVAPDDANFIIAITDNNTSMAASGGPRRAYYSIDGGNNWKDTLFGSNLSDNEYISCLDISYSNSGNRDIVIGTRSIGDTQGRLLTVRYSSSFTTTWANQPLPAVATAVTSVKFSPNYISDQTIAVISFTGAGATLHLGKHDATLNTTQWDNLGGYTAYPVSIINPDFPLAYVAGNIIRTGIELP